MSDISGCKFISAAIANVTMATWIQTLSGGDGCCSGDVLGSLCGYKDGQSSYQGMIKVPNYNPFNLFHLEARLSQQLSVARSLCTESVLRKAVDLDHLILLIIVIMSKCDLMFFSCEHVWTWRFFERNELWVNRPLDDTSLTLIMHMAVNISIATVSEWVIITL